MLFQQGRTFTGGKCLTITHAQYAMKELKMQNTYFFFALGLLPYDLTPPYNGILLTRLLPDLTCGYKTNKRFCHQARNTLSKIKHCYSPCAGSFGKVGIQKYSKTEIQSQRSLSQQLSKQPEKIIQSSVRKITLTILNLKNSFEFHFQMATSTKWTPQSKY